MNDLDRAPDGKGETHGQESRVSPGRRRPRTGSRTWPRTARLPAAPPDARASALIALRNVRRHQCKRCSEQPFPLAKPPRLPAHSPQIAESPPANIAPWPHRVTSPSLQPSSFRWNPRKPTAFRIPPDARCAGCNGHVESALSEQMKAGLGIDPISISGSMQAVDKLSSAGRIAELISRGQDIVSKAQVRNLHQTVTLLDAVLADRQKQYYVVVDASNEDGEKALRYKLIMALILTARDFIKVTNAKIILALRRDLIETCVSLNA